ncbi:Os01g0180850, partial [Oryza sativa Japonica Group]
RFVRLHLLAGRFAGAALAGLASRFSSLRLLLWCLGSASRGLGRWRLWGRLWLRSWFRLHHYRDLSTDLSTVSAFFFKSEESRTGLACFGRASCCCIFSLSQTSASEHWLINLLFLLHLNVIKLRIFGQGSISETVDTVSKLVDGRASVHPFLVPCLNGTPHLQTFLSSSSLATYTPLVSSSPSSYNQSSTS